MNRRVALVLGLTFGALVAATVWVPVEHFILVVSHGLAGPVDEGPGRSWAWSIYHLDKIRWAAYSMQLVIPFAVGGLLALFFRTRAARGAA